MCANRRPVRGRAAQDPAAQAQLVPLAQGHAIEPQAPAVAARGPFGESAPEATFSLAQVRACDTPVPAPRAVTTPLVDIAQHVRTAPPSFREIRAAAATRAPAAQVRIPAAEVDASQAPLPGMDQLVERVRQRTAARLSRSSAHLA